MSVVVEPRPLLFVVGSVVNLAYSRRALQYPRAHGFYRFFVFEGVLALLLLHGAWGPTMAPAWLKVLAQLALALSFLLVMLGFFELKRHGAAKARKHEPANMAFENTSRLVTTGVYRYIRHPMYCSLLLLVWGLLMEYPTWPGLLLATLTSALILITAKVEERENIEFFGSSYDEYRKKTGMFLPLSMQLHDTE